MNGSRQFARVEARIKSEITKTWRENNVHLRRLTLIHIKNKIVWVSAGFTWIV